MLGVTVKIVGSLLVRPTNVGPAAGVGNTTENGNDCPWPTASFDKIWIAPAPATTTLVAVSATLGSALAWIVVVPVATGVTRTFTLTAPAANVTVAGTVAMVASSELRLIVRPPSGAGVARFRVRSSGLSPVTVVVGAENVILPITRTVCLSEV